MATLTGRTVRSTLPPCDTPGVATASPRSTDGLSRTAAEAAWHAVTPYVAGGPASVSGGALELGVVVGLTLASCAKWGLGRAWPAVFGKRQPERPPGGRHRSAR